MGEFDEHDAQAPVQMLKRTGKKRYVREEDVESYFCEQVARAGGIADKFVTPGRAGAPDRIVYWPILPDELVELKTIGGRLEKSQIIWHRRYTTVTGKKITILWTRRQVDEWVLVHRRTLFAAAYLRTLMEDVTKRT